MTDKKYILIIDDEPNNIRALKLDLEDHHYEVLTAADGVLGWAVLEANAAPLPLSCSTA